MAQVDIKYFPSPYTGELLNVRQMREGWIEGKHVKRVGRGRPRKQPVEVKR